MQFPAIDDTIIAISSGWGSSAVGIVRLSGPDSFKLVRALGAPPPPRLAARPTRWSDVCLTLDESLRVPAGAYWFHRPRSYTGQDLVELHTVGCLPLLRELCVRLIARGARRALPGEFTARAFLAGKLAAEQVEDVLALISTDDAAAVRQARRAQREARRSLVSEVRRQVAELLSLVEAGIDFVEEEGIRFVTAAEVTATIDAVLRQVATLLTADRQTRCAGKPHVALVGLPNAGKSTLFNALAGHERAIVSPVLGTTRDVLSAEITVGGAPVVLQDCAGLGTSADELELAAHLAAERAADQADLVLWVHAADAEWDERETQAAARIPAGRRLLVWSKVDLAPECRRECVPVGFAQVVSTSATTDGGLSELEEAVCRLISRPAEAAGDGVEEERLRAAANALERARQLAEATRDELAQPELVALELRGACDELSDTGGGELVEELLGRVFSQFCVGK